MPLISFEIERPADVTETRHRRFMNSAHRQTMEWFQEKRLPMRFRRSFLTAPGGPLGYVRRSKSYLKRKYGGTVPAGDDPNPNVLTGQTRTIALGAKVRATFKNATLRFRPNFQSRGRAGDPTGELTFSKFVQNKQRRLVTDRIRNASENLQQRIRELEAIAPTEQPMIRDRMLKTYNDQLKAFRRTRKRVRISR